MDAPWLSPRRPSSAAVWRVKRIFRGKYELRVLVALCVFPYSNKVVNPAEFGAMVQRLARGPFKAEIRVRFPLALPSF